MKKVFSILFLMLFAFSVGFAHAEYSKFPEKLEDMSQSDSYGEKAAGMSLGGLEKIISSPFQYFTKENYAEGAIQGAVGSTKNFLYDVVDGIVDVVGSLIPGYTRGGDEVSE